MVYWGCSTARNRCAWAAVTAFALAAAALLCVGAAQMWGCNHRASTAAAGGLHHPHVGSCRTQAGIIMALCPVVIIAGLLPSLLFFQSCFAVPPPPPEDWEKDVPASSITVVRQTSQGAAVYRYDTHGRLMTAPDCYRHKACRAPPSPGKPHPGQQWNEGDPASAGTVTQHSLLGGGLGQQRASSPVGLQSPNRPSVLHHAWQVLQSSAGLSSPAGPVLGREQHSGPLTLSSSMTVLQQGSWGQYSPSGTAGGQYSPQHSRQYSPQQSRQYSPQQSRQYSPQGSTAEEAPAADVYICLSPLKEAAGKAWPALAQQHHHGYDQ